VWKSVEDLKNPISDLPIKKRINTELFIDGKHKLYIHKGGSIGPLRERYKQQARTPEQVEMKNQ